MPWVLERILVALGLIWLVATLVFLVIHLIPGDPAELLLTQGGVAPPPGAIEKLREQLGLNRPLIEQYAAFMSALARGDLGKSLLDGHAVVDEVLLRLPRTLELIAAAGVISALIGVPAGAFAAMRAGGVFDRIASIMAGLAVSVPVFVIGTLAILVLAQWLRLVPAGGYIPFARDPWQHIVLLLLPAGTIAVGLAAAVFQMTRSSVIETLGRDYVRAAEAKGLSRLRIALVHVVRNALIPVLTVLALHLGTLLGGTVLVEYVFNWPGLSGYLVRAVEQRDYPEVMGIVLVISVLFVLLNLLVDLLYAVLDPRVRHAR
jgi:peptide/nickel transport system permease protein